MEFFKPGRVVDFMRHRRLLMTVSVVLALASIIGLFYPGPNFGTDFVGGTEVQAHFQGDVSPAELRQALGELNYQDPEVLSVVDRENTYIIRVRDFSTIDRAEKQRMEQAVRAALPEGATLREMKVPEGGDSARFELSQAMDPQVIQEALTSAGISVLRVGQIGQPESHTYEAQLAGIADEMIRGLGEKLGAARAPERPDQVVRVGPRAGAQLRDAAIKSLLYAIAFIMVYVAFRFDLRFAPGGVIALLHDSILTVGVFVLVQKEFNLTIIAALLTIVGYSINDTIVVYDRVRENLARHRDKSLYDVINISTSETLGRTIMTSATTLLSVSAFFFWGTDVIKDLSFALFFGILVGTYSSIYIAAPLTEWMDRMFFSKSKARAKKARAARQEP